MSNVNIPIYDVVIDDEQLGLTAVSFVKDPAISIDFLALEKQKVENMIWFSKHYKHEIVSPVLIPNQLILRQTKDGDLYYIRWTEEAIANAAAKFLANGFWNNVTINHPMMYDENLTYKDILEEDVYLLRMWIVQDPKNDDAKKLYGFNVPKGTLMTRYKVHNKGLWQQIVDGTVKGLSIEAFTNVVKSNNDVKLNINMNKLDVTGKELNLFQKFIGFLNEVSAEASELADIAKKDEAESGEVSLKYYLDDEHYMEVDAEGFVRDEEYNLVAEGEYKLADGNVIVVGSDNKLVETKEEGEVSEEEPVEAPLAEEKLKDEEKKDEDVKEDEGEPKSESGDTESEGDAVGDAEGNEDDDEEKKKVAGAELDDKEKKDEEVPVEAPVEEVPTEEQPTEEPPLTLVPFVIDGVEYQLPQEVVDYINALVGEKDNAMNEIALMKEQMPSATPIPTVINQSVESVEDSETDGLFSAIKALNRKR